MITKLAPEWSKRRFKAMGCQFKLWLEADTHFPNQLLADAETMINDIERILTRFDPASELNRLNALPRQWVKVSSTLWEAVSVAKQMALRTGGLYDPTMLTAVEDAGYDVSYEQIIAGGYRPSAAKPTLNRVTGLWQSLQFRRDPLEIWLPEGARLDLGGVGKGFAAWQVVDFLQDYGPCLVDAGGDLSAGDAPYGLCGWPVVITAPLSGLYSEARDVIGLWLRHESLATSGIDYRRWKRNGQESHHIIDPRTGIPAETDVISVSVLATDAVEAEALATAALVGGIWGGTDLLDGERTSAALIAENEQIYLTGYMYSRAEWQLPVIREWESELDRSVYRVIIDG